MYKLLFLALFAVGAVGYSYGQSSAPKSFQAKGFQSIECKIGKNGLLQLPVLPTINLLYQRNLTKNLAGVFYSELTASVSNQESPEAYLVINHFRLVEAIGIGPTFGGKSINNSLFFLTGGRYYRSRTQLQEELAPELLTRKLMPELGVLYNLRLGQGKFYFALQYYASLYPWGMFKARENFNTLSLGCGYKF